ncbi:heptaprenyl diphosphate synthase [Bacillus salacetis]|uniref:Heptaprenyl diphosphate synthase n=1 Tax=Bacillus salacetis TaxID=2315464 RepID=A0A3A1R2X5_9BACI|nr:heptaprenyl diphosphate synthase component 1 [Bacillus salacetis]RIW33154.1 heptaprenyl diphosphate synthase [Bacillus salacetis]
MKHLDCFHLEASIKHYVEEKLSYSYLQQYIDSPQIDEDRISFLLLPFTKEKELDDEEVIRLISTVMLIQIGLDTHEKVTNSPKDSLKERQLTVLAGVYFSGQYYKILSELENVSLITLLAQAIKTVNESKISLYKNEFLNVQQIMDSVKTIESAVINSFLEHYGNTQWQELVREILFLQRLVHEERKLEQGVITPLLPSLNTALSAGEASPPLPVLQKQKLGRVFTGYILESRDRISKMMRSESFDGQFIEGRILSLLEQTRPYTKIFAEEG